MLLLSVTLLNDCNRKRNNIGKLLLLSEASLKKCLFYAYDYQNFAPLAQSVVAKVLL